MKQRNINCDILRIIAFTFVVMVHCLSFIEFYRTINEGPIMLVLNILRCLFMTCVPLFIILTGYLMNKKELNKDYIKKISRIIITYILCSIICLIFLHYIENREVLDIKDYIFSILSFKAAPYSWYVNMYLGLYIIIPFLNILWKNLKTKKNKQQLIIVLLILFVLPTITNIFNFYDSNWWINPSLSTNYQILIPNYWLGNGYPILYYYIGCYLKEYKINISKIKNIIIMLMFLIIFGIFNFYRNYNSTFDWGMYTEYYSFEVCIISILLSNLILNNINIKIKNKTINVIIKKVSYLTFGAYLLSRIFDVMLYPLIINKTIYIKERLPYCIPIILGIIVGSLFLSFITDIIQSIIIKIIKKVILISSQKKQKE